MSPPGAATYWHTLKELKPVQIYGRVLFKATRPKADLRAAPRLRPLRTAHVAPATRIPSMLGPATFRFLNETRDLDSCGWDDPQCLKLWRYNLHYFDDLAATHAGERRDWHRALILRWISENPPGRGSGWEPYPISLRVVNWIKWGLLVEPLDDAAIHSLAVQMRWLCKRIEWHLLGNHLLANAKALVIAGLFFEGPEAEGWLAKGLAILARQLPEQVLADGGHFELSPMYHAIILEDLMDILAMAESFGQSAQPEIAGMRDIVTRMRAWLAAMTHPDGGPAFFNDAAFGIAPRRETLEAYAGRLEMPQVSSPGEGAHHLVASGYVRVNRGPVAAILDTAAVGPDYIPGHAHADTLSFELSHAGERVLVNTGTSTYEAGARRKAERATAAHNTVEIDGLDSSEVWSSFRVARRARITDLEITHDAGTDRIGAAHDGYRARLPGRPLHRRTWTFAADAVTIDDAIEGAQPLAAVARYHLAPGITAALEASGTAGALVTRAGNRLHWRSSCPMRLEAGTWSPEFGRRVPNQHLVGALGDGRMSMTIGWS